CRGHSDARPRGSPLAGSRLFPALGAGRRARAEARPNVMSDYDTDIVAELAALREEQDRLGEAFASALADLRTHQEHILTELEAIQLNQAKILRDEQSKILTGEQFEALRECAD